MICPFCRFPDSKVIDSRPKDDRIKRRRECIKCGARFTTYEIIEKPMLMVKKRSGSYEPFDRSKLIKGIFSAIKNVRSILTMWKKSLITLKIITQMS